MLISCLSVSALYPWQWRRGPGRGGRTFLGTSSPGLSPLARGEGKDVGAQVARRRSGQSALLPAPRRARRFSGIRHSAFGIRHSAFGIRHSSSAFICVICGQKSLHLCASVGELDQWLPPCRWNRAIAQRPLCCVGKIKPPSWRPGRTLAESGPPCLEVLAQLTIKGFVLRRCESVRGSDGGFPFS